MRLTVFGSLIIFISFLLHPVGQVQAMALRLPADGGGGGGLALPTNGTFETAQSTNPSLPLAWTNASYGSNTPVFSYPVTGRTGKGAKVSLTQYSSGDAKWMFAPIHASAGQTFTYQNDYQSNVVTNVSIEFHMLDGSYTYGWLGNPAASSVWTTFSGQFTMPSGADTFTIFQSLTGVGSLTLDNVRINDTTNGPTLFPNGIITLTFDDTLASQYTAGRPILNAAGIKVSYYAITDSHVGIGSSPSYMTWSQVTTLKSEGNEIGAHTRTHPDLTTLSTSQAQLEITGSRDDLIAHGITPTTFVYPYGAYNASVKQLVKNAGFVGARGVFDGFNFRTSDMYALVDKHIESTTTVSDVQQWIAQAQANKTWLILELHDQTANGPDQYHNDPAVLQGIVQAIQTSGIPAVTLAQGLAQMNH